MGWEFWFTLAVVFAMIVGLIQERLTPDTLVLGALVILLLAGVVDPSSGLAGFASQSFFTVGALFVIAAALQHTGALQRLASSVLGASSGLRTNLFRLTGLTALGSAFLNNTPIVAMLLPGVVSWGRRVGTSPSKLLIPLSYAAIVGGVCTLIGTSTNLVVSGLLEAQGSPGFSMFELAWVGIPCALISIVFLSLLGPRMLPDRIDVLNPAGDSSREYLVEMRIQGPSELIGKTVENAGLRHLLGLFLVRIERDTGTLSPVGPGEILCDGDRLTFAGVVDTIVELNRAFRGLVPAGNDRPEGREHRWRLHEAVISSGSPLVGQNIRDANFRGRYNAAVIAVHRHGDRIASKIGDIILRPGDVLLLEATQGFERTFRNSSDFYLVSEIDRSEAPRRQHSARASLVLLGVVALAASGLVPIVIAALAGAMGVLALRCLSPGDARGAIDASVLIVIAASLGIARALEQTGVAGVIGSLLVSLSEGLGPYGVLVAVYLVTMLLTELITNNAAAALVFPIAMASAGQLDLDPRPFAVAVAVAASLSLATPLGYQTNLMVYGPGGYRFTDFMRIGVPLQLVLAAVALSSIYVFWPL
ncbi:MAG: SLC13 family permease [bacterium]|nr:SLC13 family permease [bacterium]